MMTRAAGRLTPAASVLVAVSTRSAPLRKAFSTIALSSCDKSATTHQHTLSTVGTTALEANLYRWSGVCLHVSRKWPSSSLLSFVKHDAHPFESMQMRYSVSKDSRSSCIWCRVETDGQPA